MRCSAAETASAWASVLATTKRGPIRPAASMLLTALPPPPPTPITTMRGFIAAGLGVCSSLMRGPSESLPQPLAHALQITARHLSADATRALSGGGIESDRNQAHGRREDRVAVGGRYPVHRIRPTDPHRPAERLLRKASEPFQLAAAAGENDAMRRQMRHARAFDALRRLGQEV